VRPPLWLAASLLAGCVTGSFDRGAEDEPIPVERLAAMRPGHDTLGSCLDALGAPHEVFEHEVAPDGSAGVGLVWRWRNEVGWGLVVSSGDDSIPGSVSIDRDHATHPGCVLWFGADLVLQRWRVGTVGDPAPGRRRPATAETPGD